MFINSRLSFSAGYYSAPIFFTIQRIWIVFGRCLFNCPQAKFIAIILVMSVVFYAIFCLTDFWSDAFDFLSKLLTFRSALRAFQLCFSSYSFGDLYLWCEGRKRGWIHSHCWPHPATTASIPPPRCWPPPPLPLHQPPGEPPPRPGPPHRVYVRTTDQ